MREILFRGKCVDSGEWVYGVPIKKALVGSHDGYYPKIIPECDGRHQTVYSTAIKEETLGQYTGLKDKNGTKIFEFDICKAYIHIYKVGKKELTGAICFEEGAFKFKCKRYIFNIYGLSASIEVIGNVFDNSLEE